MEVARHAAVAANDVAESAGTHAPLGAGRFQIWRWLAVRSAGFPADMVRSLAAPELERLSDAWRASEEAHAARRGDAIAALGLAMDALRSAEDLPGARERLQQLRRVRRKLDRAAAERPGSLPTTVADALDAFAAAAQDASLARDAFAAAWTIAATRVHRALVGIAASPQFREAVLWESPGALKTGVDPFARAAAGTAASDSRTRQREQLVTQYAQRFCTKNDTIGFFGPSAWARLEPSGPGLAMEAGPHVVHGRQVFFEAWGIEALAAALSRDPRLKPHLPPRRRAFVDLDRDVVRVPMAPPRVLPEAQAELLRRCDGVKSARAVAWGLVADLPRAFADEGAVLAMLAAFETLGLVTWRLEVPWSLHPERELERRLLGVEDPAAREPGLRALAELERARRAVADAAGDADAVDHAQEALSAVFTRLTGRPPRRAGGFYSARSIVYEECRRDVRLALGPGAMERLAPPLALVLDSARWLTQRFWRGANAALRQAYHTARATSAEPDLASLMMAARDPLRAAADEAQREVQARWAGILRPPAGAREVLHRTEELRAAVAAAFPRGGTRWALARHMSVDAMLAAPSLEAVHEGRFRWVLGEVHPASNLLGLSCFNVTHPAREALEAAMAIDVPERTLIPIEPSEGPIEEWNVPSYRVGVQTLVPPHARRLDLGGPLPAGRAAVPIGRLRLADEGGVLVVRDREDGATWPLIDVLGRAFLELCPRLSMLPEDPHTPRVVVDGVIVCRETWRCPAVGIGFAAEADPMVRFHAARQWARSLGLPRFVFAWSPEEKKPVYVDWCGPGFIDIVARWSRRALEADAAARLTFTEMLPAHDELWLADAHGRRYTSEWRLVVVDPR